MEPKYAPLKASTTAPGAPKNRFPQKIPVFAPETPPETKIDLVKMWLQNVDFGLLLTLGAMLFTNQRPPPIADCIIDWFGKFRYRSSNKYIKIIATLST